MKIKLRSAQCTEGRRMAGARALWIANGMKREMFGKPIIAIANSFTQLVPGHTHLHEAGQIVKAEIERLGCYAAEFNTIAIDDGIAMGHDGMLYSLPSRDIIADSANPQSIGEFWDNGFSIFPANKTPGSRDFGYRWLQSLNEIVIDTVRCPNTLHEFLTMEYLKDKDGKYINDYPKICDDGIDAIRYALSTVMPYGIK